MLKLLALAALLAAAAATPRAVYPDIRDFRATGSTLTSVTLSWTLDATEFVPIKYTLIVDGILTMEFFYDGSDTYTANGLSSCKEYTFDLTADYDAGNGAAANTFGKTAYETPGAISDLSVTGSIISWSAPTNARCVEYYTVCYHSTVTDNQECTEGVITTNYDMGTVSACDELDVTVSAVGGGITGQASSVHVATEDGVPGTPIDLEVVPLTPTSVLLAWNPPLSNPACVVDYAITYGHVTNFTAEKGSDKIEVSKREEEAKIAMKEGPNGQKETAVLEPLDPCTDYRFGVAAVADGGDSSDEEVVYMATNGSAPGYLPDVVYEQDEESITISWGDVSKEPCLNLIQICYVEPIEHVFDCVEVPPSSPNTWTLSGLGACREYDFSITGLSPDGMAGDSIVTTVPTKDRAPGSVQNLAVGSVEMTSLTVTYEAPIDYPECADEYIVTYKNILDVLETRSAAALNGSFATNIDGLDACASYSIGVSAVSPTGIEGLVSNIGATLKQGVPDAPSFGQLVTSTENSLTVLWYAPTDTRFCLDTYEAKLSGTEGLVYTKTIAVLGYNQEILQTFNSLTRCTSYKVEIKSKNSETATESEYGTILSDAFTLC